MESVRDIPLPGEVVPEKQDDEDCVLEVSNEHTPVVITVTDAFTATNLNASTESLNERTLEIEIGALMSASQNAGATEQTLEEVMNEMNAELAKSSEHILSDNQIKSDALVAPTSHTIEQHEVVEATHLIDQCEISAEPAEYMDQCEVITEAIEFEQDSIAQTDICGDSYIEQSDVVEQTEAGLEQTSQFIEQIVVDETELVEQTSQYIEQTDVCLKEQTSDVSFDEPPTEIVEQSDISYEEQTSDLVEHNEVNSEPTEISEQIEPTEICEQIEPTVEEQQEIVEIPEKPDQSTNEQIEVAGTSTESPMEITEIEADSNLEPKQAEPIVTYEPSEADSTESRQTEEKQNDNLTFEQISTENSSSSVQGIVEEPEENMAVESHEEEEEVTEVLVMEPVHQENAMEVGQLTENVTIEIIDTLKEYTIETTDKVKEKTDDTVYIVQEIAENDQKVVVTDPKRVINTDKKTDAKIKVEQSDVKPKPLGRPRTIVTRNSNQHPDLKGPLPCHLLGRNVDNPTEDLISNGRTPPKPRLGVKVPYRFLTSQIVSKDEITDELLELVAKRNPQPDPPMGGDIFFAQKLTQRLANKIAASESLRNKLATEKAELIKCDATITEPTKLKSKTIESSQPKSSESPKAKSTITESPKAKSSKKSSITTVPLSSKSPETSTSKINDNSDLLAILEGDVDVDWTKELRSPKKTNDPNSDNTLTAEHIVSVTVTKEKSRIDLNPELERQLALKQLQEMPTDSHFGRGRRKQVFHHQDLYKPIAKSISKPTKQEEQPGSSRVLRGGSSPNKAEIKEKKIETITKDPLVDVKTMKDETKLTESKKQDVIKDDTKPTKNETKTTESKKQDDNKDEQPTEAIQKEVEEKATIIDDVEPTISPSMVMKTYSRKEVVLNVPPGLEYIVNETDPSALIELEKEPELSKEDPKSKTSKNTPKPITSKETPKPETTKDTPKPETSKDTKNIDASKETSTTETSKDISKATAKTETQKADITKEIPKAVTTKVALKPEALKETPKVETPKKEIKIPAILTKIGDLKSAIDKKMESMKIAMDLQLDTAKSTTDKKSDNPKVVIHKISDNPEKNAIIEKKEKKTKAQVKVAQKAEMLKKVVVTKKQKRISEPELMLVSKRARIIKKKVIWDPAEVPKVRAPAKKIREKIVEEKKSIVKKDVIEQPVEVIEPVQVKEEKVPNGQTGPKASTKLLHKKKMLPNAALRRVRKAQQLIISRQLRSISQKMIRSANGERKALAMSKKKKTAIVEQIKRDKPKKTELDRLLMDEGAVNMLYSVRGKGLKRKAGVSRDRHHKELMNRTQMVKDVITQSSNQEDSPKALRKKDSPVAPIVFTNPPRKKSRDSVRSSLQSPPPSPSFLYAHRAEASRIIRRHSSSFSSDCSSPRRLSIDVTQNPVDPKPTQQESEKEPIKETPEIQTRLRRKGVPIFERKLEEKTYKGKKRLLPDESKEEVKEERLTEQASQKLTPTEKRKLNAEMSKNFSQQPLKKRTRSSKGIDEEEELSKEEEKEEKPKAKTPVKTPKKVEAEKKLEPEKKIEPEVVEQKLETAQQIEPEKILEPEKKDTRQVSVASEYKEISLKRMDNLVQIILTPTSTKLKNTINLAMFTEMVHILTHLSQDVTCRVVLLTSTDSTFCHGVNFSTLIQTDAEKRLVVAQEMAKAVKDFLHCLASFPKPLVAGVQGSTVGLGVTMLPLFDLVFASDKATFSTPYGRLGQVPEGIAFLTLPHLLGNSLTSELLLASRKLTASEALHHGLVTRILWPDKFQEEVMTNSAAIAKQSSQSMIATKRLLRKTLLAKLDEALESETKLLVEHWCSTECQQNFKKMVEEDEWW